MKRILSLTLALALMLSMSACSGGATNTSSDSGATSSTAEVEVDKNLLTVDVTLPATFFAGEDMPEFDADEYAAENGFKSATLNGDGSVTVTMSKADYAEMMAEAEESTKSGFAELIGSEQYPYITDITYSEKFGSVSIYVNRAGYDADPFVAAFIPLVVYLPVAFYQAFDGADLHCEISFVDAATGDVVNSVVYPDALAD